MQEPNQNQNKSLEMKNYKNIMDNNSQMASPFSIKSNNNFSPYNNKENCDSNKPYLISDNSQSAINPLSKSHENLDTSNNLINNNLFTAVEYNDIERVNELLKNDNSKINDLNEEGLSLLHIAVIKGNIKMINLLLSYGADSNICSEKKRQTPLHLAYLNQNSMTEEIIKELLKYKANDNIYDSKNKRPSDYMYSSSKKNRHKKYNINDNSNNDYNNSADKKSYINNNTGNTITVVTIENHLDSFLTTNKEDDKSNQNNINTNSNNNTIIQTPTKLDVYYDYNEIVSINNSVEKSNNQLNNKSNNILTRTIEEDNKSTGKPTNRRQYTFGKEDDYFKFQNKNNEISLNINSNNINNNNNLEIIDINNNCYFENIKKENNNINDEENNNLNSNENSNINKEDLDKTPKENEILNDSLENEENNINEKNDENENEREEEEKEEVENNEELYDSLKNNNLLNKDNNIQNSFNLNNNSLTYTESVNVNGSCFQSKNKISQIKMENGSNNNTYENDDNKGNNVDEEIELKQPYNDKNINVDSMEKNNEEINDNINDIFLTNIIKKKRNSFKKCNKFANMSRASINSANNNLTNRNIRLSEYNTLNLGENDFNNSLRSNRTNYLSPLAMHKKIMSENKNNIKYVYKQKKIESYNSLINHNNSYKNSNTIIHNGNDSRLGFTGDATQYSTQSQNNKKKLLNSSKERIKVIMNESSIPNSYNNNERITEFNCNDNIINNNNIYNNNNTIDNNINFTYLKYWLNNLGLIDYLKCFIDSNIYDINNLVERMKSYQTKLRYETLESILKIRIPGYLYRILCKLEADAGLIDPKIVKFMIRDGINNDSKNNVMNRSNNNENNNLNISISQSYYHCYNCCKMNQLKKQKKNDLKYFLLRNDLINLYQNFYHNGFDMIEYVIIQMYSSFPINDDILENYFHIYDEKTRTKVLKAIVSEMKIINRFMNSDEYNNNCDKNKIKYDNVLFEENKDKDKSKIYVNDKTNNNDSECIVF